MSAPPRSDARDTGPDQRVFLHGVPWAQYEAIDALRAGGSVPRLTYLHGVLELMSPAWNHEDIKKRLARLVEAWADATGTPLTGVGSWTVKRPEAERGAEADECYVLGEFHVDDPHPDHPDIAIEVVWTHGGLDKLEVWRELGVREVWIWDEGELTARILVDNAWVCEARSRLLPSLDLTLLATLLREETQQGSVRKLRAILAQHGP